MKLFRLIYKQCILIDRFIYKCSYMKINSIQFYVVLKHLPFLLLYRKSFNEIACKAQTSHILCEMSYLKSACSTCIVHLLSVTNEIWLLNLYVMYVDFPWKLSQTNQILLKLKTNLLKCFSSNFLVNIRLNLDFPSVNPLLYSVCSLKLAML